MRNSSFRQTDNRIALRQAAIKQVFTVQGTPKQIILLLCTRLIAMEQFWLLNNTEISGQLAECNDSPQIRWAVINYPDREIETEDGLAWLDDGSSLISNNYEWLLMIKLQSLATRDLWFHVAANARLPHFYFSHTV